ncbi:hypothetical protein BJ165DRAFT_1502374 [Panaeolus papilionaceus]|nr:hypothetical protein BJ165DRAFT_1502374 [Panaeolus papilionaceus]
MPTASKSAQVAIAIFYDCISNAVIHNALAIIDENYFINRPQYGTMFYVLRSVQGKWLIQPYTYKTAQSNDLVFIGLVHIGFTTKHAKLVENRLVGSLAAQSTSDPDSLSDWVVNAAFEHVYPHRTHLKFESHLLIALMSIETITSAKLM